ncbi:glycoside hydrolase [Euhalothece natronophila Z-M001]|uniref:Glycoside hydrolase n=1 Tax=Euhalothece natronophila Z-M001 TaxID=522448 RepID=A0A5B8NM24_9CHRO|nr:glycosyl hydrolase-related protein [Euhalothece natronophila]QDZ39997.1 glycoside hydrolase [Euhalothece natronophila Z-M001]
MSPKTKTIQGIIVSHTHWDRAWYLPFQSFRHRLVRMVDELMDILETDPNFRAFTLDGQTVLLEDYLEIRPEQETRLKKLIQSGRILIGPWFTMPDLFLISGESVIRNLQEGRKWCEKFGNYMAVGYLPDPFGHFAQMPQIFQGFDIDSYIFMRGLDAETKASHGAIFNWQSPDGSTVLAIYEREGYFPVGSLGHPSVFGRFEGHEVKVDLAKKQIEQALETMLPLQAEETVLLSNGFDHLPVQKEIPQLLSQLNESLEGIELTHGTIPEFVEAIKQENQSHQTYQGDLIGNADQPILASVYSTRMYLKQQNHSAQQLLSRYVEPLSVWLESQGWGNDVRPFLNYSWRLLFKNHAHDDICGCSVDGVHDDDEYRFRQIEQIGEGLLVEHLETLLKQGFIPPQQTGDYTTDVFVLNPHPWEATYTVETEVYFPNPDGEWGEPLPPLSLTGCDGHGKPIKISVLDTEAPKARSRYLETTWGRYYQVSFSITLPPLGYQLVHIYQTSQPLSTPETQQPLTLENQRYQLTVTDNTLTLTEKTTGIQFSDFLQLEYQPDLGDTYSFSPVPDVTPIWGKLTEAKFHPQKADTLRLTYQLNIQDTTLESIPSSESQVTSEPSFAPFSKGGWGDHPLQNSITVDLSLNTHESISIQINYESTVENARIRAVLPLGFTTKNSLADGHFRLVSREKPQLRTPESDPQRYQTYPGELDYPTHHQGDFVLFTGDNYQVWVANRGLPEYEVIGDKVAITLHRAVGYLSVGKGRIRPCQAGPSVPTPGAQCKREINAELAYGLANLEQETIIRKAREFAHPAWGREMPYLPYVNSTGQLGRYGSLCAIDNPNIILSALKPHEEKGIMVLRVYNQTEVTQTATVTFGWNVTAYCETNLLEMWEHGKEVSNQELSIQLYPHQIKTFLLQS